MKLRPWRPSPDPGQDTVSSYERCTSGIDSRPSGSVLTRADMRGTASSSVGKSLRGWYHNKVTSRASGDHTRGGWCWSRQSNQTPKPNPSKNQALPFKQQDCSTPCPSQSETTGKRMVVHLKVSRDSWGPILMPSWTSGVILLGAGGQILLTT